jgi:hypothetical protein
LVSDTESSQPPEKTSITPREYGLEIGPNIEPLTQTTKTAPYLNPITGRVPNNALNHGSAEVPDSVKEEDGAPDMMDVREPHFQTKLQDLPPTAEHEVQLSLS